MSDDAMFIALVACIWIGWPLHRIAGHLKFITQQIKERR